jgi:hypothetical protein
VNIDGDRLVAWTRRVEELKKGSYVQAIGRFSNPPRIEDLADVSLDAEDLRAIQKCHPGNCALKLSAPEMTKLQQAAKRAHGDWMPAVQQAFRQVILERVKTYLSTGKTPPYEDHRVPLSPASRFASLLDHTGFLTSHEPQLAAYLRNYPRSADSEVESFLYWSKERPAGKAIISVTQVNIIRNHDPQLPDTLIVSKDIFSSHYVNASLGVTALIRVGPDSASYLVYVNRTEIDILHGAFSGVMRGVMQRRLKAGAENVLETYRRRLESGDPPPEPLHATSKLPDRTN